MGYTVMCSPGIVLQELLEASQKSPVVAASQSVVPQAQLAAELEVSRQTVNAIEKGKFDPSLPLAFKAARLFGMAIEDIFQYSSDS